MGKVDEVVIRREPRERDIDAIIRAARQAVEQIAAADGAIGPDEVSRLYAERMYAAVVALGRPA